MTFHLTNPIVNPFFTQNAYINFADLDMSAKLNFDSDARDRSWPSELHAAGLLDFI